MDVDKDDKAPESDQKAPAAVFDTRAVFQSKAIPMRKAPPTLEPMTVLEGVQYIDSDELAKELGQTLVVDVRASDFYGGHIPDSLRIPFDDILEHHDILEELVLDAVKAAEKSHVVFCCMHGEPKSRMCADKLVSALEDRIEIETVTQIGFLVGGIHGWVNRFADQSGQIRLDLFSAYDPDAWPVDGTKALSSANGAATRTHTSKSDLKGLLSVWGSSEEVSTVLRKAKSFLSRSSTTSLQVADEVAQYQCKQVSSYMLDPADIELDRDHLLGSGAGGVVFRAMHRPTGMPLAVKVCQIDDPSRRKQLFNSLCLFTEAWMTDKETTEGILRLRSMFVQEQRVFLAMDFMNMGGTRTLLELQLGHCRKHGLPNRGLPEKVVQLLAKQSILGLDTLHQRNMLHRDIKPDNILVNTDGVACIADFGLTTKLDDDNKSCLVATGEGVICEGRSGVVVQSVNDDGTYDLIDRTGHVEKNVLREVFTPKKKFRANDFVGTQSYLSPQMAKNSGVGLGEDIWAFGVVLFEWAMGEHPLNEHLASPGQLFGNLWEIMAEKEGITLPQLESQAGPQFSKELHDIVAKCLRKRPSERPKASQLREHPFVKDIDAVACQLVWAAWLKEMEYQPHSIN